MGNCSSRAKDSAQEKRKWKKKIVSRAMKKTTINSKVKDTMHAKSKRELRKLDEDMEKAISGQFQNDSDKEVQEDAGQDATEEGRINVTEDPITSRGVRIIKVLSEQESTEKEKMDARIRHLEAQLEQVKDEKRQLLNRLSEISAMRLYDNNPNITDLNDANRPLKLAEQFSSLYDDHWTDSFQLLQQMKMNERDIIDLLLNIVQMVFQICEGQARTTKLQLQRAILKYIGLSKKKNDETVVKEAMKIVREYRKEKFMYSLKNIRKHVQCKLKDVLNDTLMQQMNSYTEECTRLCWLMNIQDPQMFLSLGQVSCIRGGPIPFDNTCFVSYTCAGMYVDFVVWPAIFLHEGGSLLRKGVAQGTNNILVSERSATLLTSAESSGSSSKKKRRYKPSLLKRIAEKFKHNNHHGLHDEKEMNKRQNEDLEKEIKNDELNSGQNNQHLNHSANAPSVPTSITHEGNYIGLSTKTNISQSQNNSSDITKVWN